MKMMLEAAVLKMPLEAVVLKMPLAPHILHLEAVPSPPFSWPSVSSSFYAFCPCSLSSQVVVDASSWLKLWPCLAQRKCPPGPGLSLATPLQRSFWLSAPRRYGALVDPVVVGVAWVAFWEDLCQDCSPASLPWLQA